MEIQSQNNITFRINNPHFNSEDKDNHAPAFRGNKAASGILNKSGDFMNWIENGGFMVLFLIQDFLGMTVPRSVAGFLRDREVTGKYNKQEGFEVLGREGLTGPCMMAVAPASFYLMAKYSKTTGVNSELIKYYGNSLTEMVSGNEFEKSILQTPDKFKTEFYRKNVQKILENTLGKDNVKNESVDYIMEQLRNREVIPDNEKLHWFRGKSKYRNQCMDNVINHINELKYQTSSDLDMLQKVKLEEGNICKTKNAFEGMEKYANDAITANKKLNKLDKVMAEQIKHTALGKRAFANIAVLFATLGVLSVLPKIYARSNKAPGARHRIKSENINNTGLAELKENKINNTDIAFKGKGNAFEKIGKKIDKNKNKFISSELEYNGNNFTNTLMAGLSLLGLLAPRGYRAYSRADKDENGKRDLTELWEILVRDITSSLAVIFAVPMGTRACVTSYEKNSGFVLMQKDRTKNKVQTILDLFNPYSKAHVLTNKEISSIYDNINTKEKMLNFCKYIDKNGGDLQKIISKSENADEIFNKSTFELSGLKGKSKAEKNKLITKQIEKLSAKTEKDAENTIIKVMKGIAPNKNKITSFARGLNSVPGILTTLFISPYILGWFIPRLTYRNTRRIHEKQDIEHKRNMKQKLRTSV